MNPSEIGVFRVNRSTVIAALLITATCGSPAVGQENSALAQTNAVRIVLGAAQPSSSSVIAIPPETSWTASVRTDAAGSPASSKSGKLAQWVQDMSALNGLSGADLHPWHLVVAYDQFDEDGDNVHSGVIEEIWAGPKQYRVSYRTDTLKQTDYATAQGLFREGDQRWPNVVEKRVLDEVIDPFEYAATLEGFRPRDLDRHFGPHTLRCTGFRSPSGMDVPAQYCFEGAGTILRYVRGEGWLQSAYNDLVRIDGRYVAREVDVADGGHPFLKIRVTKLESEPDVDPATFVPPADAIDLTGKVVTGVSVQPLRTAFPEWPNSLRGQHFTVTVAITIGKDGRVVSAHAVSGPSSAYKAAESAARKWVYAPYLVDGEPAEVQCNIVLSQF